MKKRATLLLLAVAMLLALAGCHAPAVPTESQPAAIPEPAATEVTPDEEEPRTEPREVPPPQPDTMPGNIAYARVTVMAHPLTYSSVTVDGEPYFALQDLAEVLEGEVRLDGATVTLAWAEGSVEIRAKSGIWFSEIASGILPGAVYRSGELLFAPLALLEDVLGLTCAVSDDGKALYYYQAASWDIPAGYSVPVLMYHGVSDENIWGYAELFVSPGELENQLQYLRDNGFTPIWFSDLSRVDEIEKPVILTFDDGHLDNYQELFPLLQQYGMKATIFVITENLGTNPNFMTWEQAREMAQSGLVAIESHTVSHPYLNTLSEPQQRTELEESHKKILEEIGIPSQVLCYPSGQYNETTLVLMEGRYEIGLLMDSGSYLTGSDPFRIPRWYVSRYTTIGSFASMVN